MSLTGRTTYTIAVAMSHGSAELAAAEAILEKTNEGPAALMRRLLVEEAKRTKVIK